LGDDRHHLLIIKLGPGRELLDHRLPAFCGLGKVAFVVDASLEKVVAGRKPDGGDVLKL